MGVQDSLSHPFLTKGSSGAFILDPTKLHLSLPPVHFDCSASTNQYASSKEEEGWKRRQLSVLISPMPTGAAYDDSVSDDRSFSIPGVSLYILKTIEETLDEAEAKFF
jgi:hypothetical protein